MEGDIPEAAKTVASGFAPMEAPLERRVDDLEREQDAAARTLHQTFTGLSDRLIDLGAAVAEYPTPAALDGTLASMEKRIAELEKRMSKVECCTAEANSKCAGLSSNLEASLKEVQRQRGKDLQAHAAKADKSAQLLESRCDVLASELRELTARHKAVAAAARSDMAAHEDTKALAAHCDQACKALSAAVKQCQRDVSDLEHKSALERTELNQTCGELKSYVDHAHDRVQALDQQQKEDAAHCRHLLASVGRRDDGDRYHSRPPWRPWPSTGKRVGSVPPRYGAQLSASAPVGGDALPNLLADRPHASERGFDML